VQIKTAQKSPQPSRRQTGEGLWGLFGCRAYGREGFAPRSKGGIDILKAQRE